ncbi:hypothetical protein ACFVT2_36250 [Streptomyces sp. NPDC058000]|uniref:hypothetical protein n=1 Tax=Streptomyces sp. NPDC058000 TaxID=3346299 RepID=UPI0036E6909E
MTKSGANGPKSRARARQQRDQTHYTTALHNRDALQSRGQVVQFVARCLSDHFSAISGIGAAWARLGLRVLLLDERKYQVHSPTARRVKGRFVFDAPPEPPGPFSVLLWEAASGAGRLVRLDMDWYAQDPALSSRDDSPLQDAIRHACTAFDITVLLPDFCLDLWRPYPVADHFVAVAGVGDLPRHETRLRMAGLDKVLEKSALTPQQSAAVLRDRHLGFLNGRGAAIHGLVCRGSAEARDADPAFYDAVVQDMVDSGIPLLGWIAEHTGKLRPSGAVPSKEHLGDDEFVEPYMATALHLLTVLPGIRTRARRQGAPAPSVPPVSKATAVECAAPARS